MYAPSKFLQLLAVSSNPIESIGRSPRELLDRPLESQGLPRLWDVFLAMEHQGQNSQAGSGVVVMTWGPKGQWTEIRGLRQP